LPWRNYASALLIKHTQTLLSGFAVGGVLLALPWPVAADDLSRWPLLLVVLVVLAVLVCAIRCCVESARGAAGPVRRTAGPAMFALLGLLGGFGWSAARHADALEGRIATRASGDAVRLIVRVSGDPVAIAGQIPGVRAVRFRAQVLEGLPARPGPGPMLRLSWYGAEPVQRGDLWRVSATVRGPWGYVNPGGFDYERWLLGQGIQGTGTVRRGVLLEAGKPRLVDRARTRVAAFIAGQQLQSGGVLTALLVGVSSGITDEQWAMFRNTGTIHLMVISGLHIGLAATLGYLVGRALSRVCPLLLLWCDARKCGALFGALFSTGYMLLSGAGIPAVRACIMAAPLLLLVASGRRCQSGAALPVALVGVLLIDPLAIHQQGFWLSFGAVLLLVLLFGRHRRVGADPRSRPAIPAPSLTLRPVAVLAAGWASVRAWGATLLEAQWALTLAMAPLLVLLTDRLSWVSALANLIAVPVVSAGVVPLTLAGGLVSLVWHDGAAASLLVADRLLSPVLGVLDLLGAAPVLQAAPVPAWALVAQVAALLWLLRLPHPLPLLLMLAMSTVLLPVQSKVAAGQFRVTALDVGQGDAILVDTARHRLLFDSGPAFPGGFETGSTVVVPGILATGPARLDALVLSHDDLDHTGGHAGVRAALPIRRTFASFPLADAEPCDDAHWHWDGVDFRFFDIPRAGPGGARPRSNEQSCVLLIENGVHRALLAGDIGAGIEGRLLRLLPGPIDLLFAPHHGSLSSSSRAFVRVARPNWVFVSAGLDNRYGHPHPRVMARYATLDTGVLQTGRHGALVWQTSAPATASGRRLMRAPYWRSSVTGADGG
jgi:competence protein ComEC